MRNKKSFAKTFFKMFFFAFLLISVSLFLGSSVLAQENEQIKLDKSKMTTVATVNIYDAKIVSQDNNKIKISFDLSNREYIQPDIKYLIQLLKEGEEGNQIIVDEFTYSEVISLGENQTIKKEVEYVAPNFLGGEYQIYILAKNQNGLPLAISNIGKVELSGNNEFVEILYNTCYLKVKGEEASRYSALQGVDINNEENLVAFCEVINRMNEDLKFNSEITTFWRSSSGAKVDVEGESSHEYSLLKNERKELIFDLPKPKNPQAYEAKLKLKNFKGETISNEANFHYVLRGLSATIQNFLLDKEVYQEGDLAKASLFWSKSADGFVGSRFKPTESEKYFVEISMLNEKKKVCGESEKVELNENKSVSEFNFEIKRICKNPSVKVSIMDKDGNILDSKDYKINTSNKPVSNFENKKISLFYGVIFIIILTFVSWLIILIKKKDGVKMTVFFLSLVVSALATNNTVKADTFIGSYEVSPQFNSNFHTLDYTLTVNTNKLNYYASESMSGTMSVNQVSCLNSLTDYNMTISLKDGHSSTTTKGISTGNGVAYSYTAWSSAPSVIGSYNAYFTFKDNRCFANSGSCLSAISSYGNTYFNNELYSSNLNSYFNSIKFQGRDDWTDSQTRDYCLNTSGSLYNHYIQYGKTLGVSPCKMNCNSSAQNLEDANRKWSVAYNVSSGGVGSCGNRNGVIYTSNILSWPSGSYLCGSGNISIPASVPFPELGKTVSWQCQGAGGGSTVNCSASRDPFGTPVPTLNVWATPNPVLQYTSTTINWNATNVDYCKPTNYTGYYPVGNLPIVGSQSIASMDSAKYFGIRCYTSTGSSIYKEVYVNITYPNVNGLCGNNINNGLPYSSLSTVWLGTSNIAFCAKGNPSPSASSIQFPPQGVVVSWRCIGTGSGTTADCSATRTLSNPTFNFWSEDSNVIILNNGLTVYPEKSVKLKWDILNATDSCSCGYGCSCTLYDGEGNLITEKPYDGQTNQYVTVKKGLNKFKLSCINQNMVESSQEIDLMGSCAETAWFEDEPCNDPCGTRERYRRRVVESCDKEEELIETCMEVPCPMGAEMREVSP